MQASASTTSPPRAISPGTMKMTQKFFEARKKSADASLVLLRSQQSFLKKLEDLRALKRNIDQYREAYIESSAILAHRDAELRYQRECLLQEEQTWSDLIESRQEHIANLRKELQAVLDKYGEERRKTAALQERVSQRTEAQRITALNAVAFCSYGQALVEREMKDALGAAEQAAVLGPARQAEKIMSLYFKALTKSRHQTRSFHQEKIAEFRRQERILLGRGKDATSHLLQQTNSQNSRPTSTLEPQNNVNKPSSAMPGTAGSGSNSNNNNVAFHDSLENRVAQKMFAMANTVDIHGQSSFIQRMEEREQNEVTQDNIAMGLADMQMADAREVNHNNHMGHRPAILRQRRASILINGEIQTVPLINSAARPPHRQSSKEEPETKSEKHLKNKPIYDPERYHQACAGEFLKPHTLLENSLFGNSNKDADRDKNLLELAALCSEARGKLRQLTIARDGLDVMLTKQTALLLTVVNGLILGSSVATVGLQTQQPQQANNLSPNSRSKNPRQNRVYRPFNSSMTRQDVSIAQHLQMQQASARPLQLSAARRIVQLDCAQKDQDILLLRSKVLAALQQHGRGVPYSAPGRITDGNQLHGL